MNNASTVGMREAVVERGCGKGNKLCSGVLKVLRGTQLGDIPIFPVSVEVCYPLSNTVKIVERSLF